MSPAEEKIFSNASTANGAATAAIFMLVLLAFAVIVHITKLRPIELVHKVLQLFMKLFAKSINKHETKHHRDVEIGKLTEKRVSFKFYRFLSELIIDLQLKDSGITPYELLYVTLGAVSIVTIVLSKILFNSILIAIVFIPIVAVGAFCIMYTRANIAHDARIEAVIEAENIICNNIKGGVVVAVRESLDVIPKSVRMDFKDFIDNIEQKNYHVKTALLELNARLGGVADDFIKKCIVFEMEEEHGIAGMFNDIVEMNNINMEMRTQMKRKFEEVKTEFNIGATMIFAFLAGVIALYPNVRQFYFTTFPGHIVLALDILLLIAEYVFLTYLRAKEL